MIFFFFLVFVSVHLRLFPRQVLLSSRTFFLTANFSFLGGGGGGGGSSSRSWEGRITVCTAHYEPRTHTQKKLQQCTCTWHTHTHTCLTERMNGMDVIWGSYDLREAPFFSLFPPPPLKFDLQEFFFFFAGSFFSPFLEGKTLRNMKVLMSNINWGYEFQN